MAGSQHTVVLPGMSSRMPAAGRAARAGEIGKSPEEQASSTSFATPPTRTATPAMTASTTPHTPRPTTQVFAATPTDDSPDMLAAPSVPHENAPIGVQAAPVALERMDRQKSSSSARTHHSAPPHSQTPAIPAPDPDAASADNATTRPTPILDLSTPADSAAQAFSNPPPGTPLHATSDGRPTGRAPSNVALSPDLSEPIPPPTHSQAARETPFDAHANGPDGAVRESDTESTEGEHAPLRPRSFFSLSTPSHRGAPAGSIRSHSSLARQAVTPAASREAPAGVESSQSNDMLGRSARGRLKRQRIILSDSEEETYGNEPAAAQDTLTMPMCARDSAAIKHDAIAKADKKPLIALAQPTKKRLSLKAKPVSNPRRKILVVDSDSDTTETTTTTTTTTTATTPTTMPAPYAGVTKAAQLRLTQAATRPRAPPAPCVSAKKQPPPAPCVSAKKQPPPAPCVSAKKQPPSSVPPAGPATLLRKPAAKPTQAIVKHPGQPGKDVPGVDESPPPGKALTHTLVAQKEPRERAASPARSSASATPSQTKEKRACLAAGHSPARSAGDAPRNKRMPLSLGLHAEKEDSETECSANDTSPTSNASGLVIVPGPAAPTADTPSSKKVKNSSHEKCTHSKRLSTPPPRRTAASLASARLLVCWECATHRHL
jgi:hypothetical protein